MWRRSLCACACNVPLLPKCRSGASAISTTGILAAALSHQDVRLSCTTLCLWRWANANAIDRRARGSRPPVSRRPRVIRSTVESTAARVWKTLCACWTSCRSTSSPLGISVKGSGYPMRLLSTRVGGHCDSKEDPRFPQFGSAAGSTAPGSLESLTCSNSLVSLTHAFYVARPHAKLRLGVNTPSGLRFGRMKREICYSGRKRSGRFQSAERAKPARIVISQ